MDSSNKSEQATPQRRKKAREQGQVPRSRDLSGALALSAALLVLFWQGSSPAQHWRNDMYRLLEHQPIIDLEVGTASLMWSARTVLQWAAPAMLASFVCATAGSLAQGGFVFAPTSLSPKFDRLSPAKKIPQLLSMSALSGLLRSLLPFSIIAVLAFKEIMRHWQFVATAGFHSVNAIFSFVLHICFKIAWKSALVLLLWSGLDYLIMRQIHNRDLRMTRQEVREEAKESEGNPQVKAQIRRMQRQNRRRQMLRDVQRASVVVTNPTHFAVALEYKPSMAAPIVVAKGQNLMALQIKEAATWHDIPMVENRSLARALYQSVDIGQGIPAQLYVAVAEILAFVYRMQQNVSRTPGDHNDR